MSYLNQAVIAQGIVNGLTVIIKEGLNTKSDLELRIEVPATHELFNAFNKGEYIYERREDLYFAVDERTGQVHYYAYSAPGTGFGGAKINVTMLDGSTETLIGPWSSRCGVINRVGFTPSKEVSIQSVYSMASAMTINAINELIAPLGYVCVPEKNSSRWDKGFDIVSLEDAYNSLVSVDDYITSRGTRIHSGMS